MTTAINTLYSYDVQAEDVDGDTLVYDLTNKVRL